jgi:hypothetical protein
MPTPPVPDRELQAAADAYREAGNSYLRGAELLGMNYTKYRHRVDLAKAKGMHLSPGARKVIDRAQLSPVEARGGWIHDYDSDGKKVGTTRWQAPQDDPATLLDRVRDAFDNLPAAKPVDAPKHHNADLMTVYPIADAHVGMMAWGKETGEDYDTRIACERITEWMGRLVDCSPMSAEALILDVGDLLHADDQTNMTPRGGHILDVDTRYFKTVDATIAALVAATNYALIRHQRVTVKILPGNHDPHACLAIVFALAAHYRDEPRVTVLKEPGEWYVQRWGNCLLSAHHGHGGKPERMVMFLADQHAAIWGQTRHRFLWTGHMHHLKAADIGGVQWEQLRALTAKDAYAVSNAYTARAQLQGITLHKERGEISRVKVGL